MRVFLMSVLFALPLAACGGLLGETAMADEQAPTTEQVYATCPGANTASEMLAKAERFLAGRDASKDRLFAEGQEYSKEYRDGIESPDRWYIALGCTTAILRMPEGMRDAPTKEQRRRAAELNSTVARLMDRPDIGLEATCRGAEMAEEFRARCEEYRRNFKPVTIRNSTPQPNTTDAEGKEVEPICEPTTLVVNSEVIDPGGRNLIRLARQRLNSDPSLCQGEMRISALPLADFQLDEAVFVLTPETDENTIVQLTLGPPKTEEDTAP